MQVNIFQKTLILAVVVGLGLGFMSSLPTTAIPPGCPGTTTGQC